MDRFALGLENEDHFRLFSTESWKAFLEVHPVQSANTHDKIRVRLCIEDWLAEQAPPNLSETEDKLVNYLNNLSPSLGSAEGVLAFM